MKKERVRGERNKKKDMGIMVGGGVGGVVVESEGGVGEE